jgi:hypothetical protein
MVTSLTCVIFTGISCCTPHCLPCTIVEE